ncbi:MAG: acylneuraminate cytidylyltransferase family protein [Candidatus Omnitrophica bacterium]|nr:acylneuraminate cytidylyltransferase family protein [Candidatus Omnitrophota bacterium]
MKNKCLAIIPARGGSKGIPGKNIKDFAGKPLIAWTIEQAKASKLISDIYVTSDSTEILEVASQLGVKVIMRPDEISGDKASSESALVHVLDQVQGDWDLIVFLQVTSPLRKEDDIDKAITQLLEEQADSLLSLTSAQEFIWHVNEGVFAPFTFDFHNRRGHQDLEPIYYENGSIYVFKPEILRKENNRLGGKVAVYVMESWQRADIDNYDDFEWCQWLYQKYLGNA